MRLGMFISWLQGGGAERQVALWGQLCAAKGHDVTVFTLYGGEGDFEMPGVRVVRLHKARATDLPRIAWRLRRASQSLDAMVAFEPYPGVCCAAARLKIPWMLVTGKDPRHWRDASNIPAGIFRTMFRSPTVLVAPSRGMIHCHQEMGLRPGGPWFCVPNIVDDRAFEAGSTANGSEGREGVLFAGRLIPLKNPLRAVEAADAADVPLKLLGRGKLKSAIESAIAERGRQGSMQLLGYDPEPWTAYAKARVLVVTSDYESFGNVLVESLAAGTPVVSVDCDFGPREIIAGADFSRLVEASVPSIAQALTDVVSRPYTLREWQECRAIAERYRIDAIAPLIEQALEQLIDARGNRLRHS